MTFEIFPGNKPAYFMAFLAFMAGAGAGAAAFLAAFIAFMAFMAFGMMKDRRKETCETF